MGSLPSQQHEQPPHSQRIKMVSTLYHLLIATGITSLGFMLWTKHNLYAVIAFLTLMIALSGLYWLQGAVFLAVMQLILHTGAALIWLVTSLWLTPTLRHQTTKGEKGYLSKYKATILGSGLFLFTLVGSITWQHYHRAASNPLPIVTTITDLGKALTTQYALIFELSGFIILLTLILIIYFSNQGEV